MQHLRLTLVGRVCGAEEGVSSPSLPPERCRTVVHYAWAACASDPHTGGGAATMWIQHN